MSILENSDIGTFSAANDKTLTMSRELAERLDSPHSYVRNLARDELRALLAAPVVERQDGSALMKIAADLANRHPLRQLYLVCKHQGRINTDSLHEHLGECGDLLAGIALDIRRAIVSPPAPVAVVLPERKTVPSYQIAPLAAEAAIGYNQALDDVRVYIDKVKELNQ